MSNAGGWGEGSQRYCQTTTKVDTAERWENTLSFTLTEIYNGLSPVPQPAGMLVLKIRHVQTSPLFLKTLSETFNNFLSFRKTLLNNVSSLNRTPLKCPGYSRKFWIGVCREGS